MVSVAKRALVFLTHHLQQLGQFCLGHLGLHLGVPMVIAMAIALVVGYRLLRRGVRLAVEVALVAAVLAVGNELIRLGWIRW